MLSSRALVSLLVTVLLSLPAVAAGRPGSLVKHTVSGSGTFEQGRNIRAEVNRATFHPIDHHFSLSVSGRMGWVITGQWQRQGDEVILRVSNMNNTPASGSGALQLGPRGTVQSVKVSGSTRGGAYRVRFKSGALLAGAPPSVRLGPSTSAPRPPPVPLQPFRATGDFDRCRRGHGVLQKSGAAPIVILAADVQLLGTGRVSVRVVSAGRTFRFDGTAGSSGSREELDLVLHASDGGTGAVTGTARMDRSGRAVEDLALRGWLEGQPFALRFAAGR